VGRGELIEGTPHAGKIFLGFRHLRPYTPYVIPFLYAVMVPLESHIFGTSTNPARTFGPADLGPLGRTVDLLGRPDAGHAGRYPRLRLPREAHRSREALSLRERSSTVVPPDGRHDIAAPRQATKLIDAIVHSRDVVILTRGKKRSKVARLARATAQIANTKFQKSFKYEGEVPRSHGVKEVPALEPNEFEDVNLESWLGGRDSNPDTVVQSHVSYRWTTSQYQPRWSRGSENDATLRAVGRFTSTASRTARLRALRAAGFPQIVTLLALPSRIEK
jgi:hypothetical protein